jgi:hypothetical protein
MRNRIPESLESAGGGAVTETRVSWRRLGTEAVVIVGSILLAFAIDAAWDRYQDERRVAEYVLALRGEFEEARLENDGATRRSHLSAGGDAVLEMIARQSGGSL